MFEKSDRKFLLIFFMPVILLISVLVFFMAAIIVVKNYKGLEKEINKNSNQVSTISYNDKVMNDLLNDKILNKIVQKSLFLQKNAVCNISEQQNLVNPMQVLTKPNAYCIAITKRISELPNNKNLDGNIISALEIQTYFFNKQLSIIKQEQQKLAESEAEKIISENS